MRRDCDISLVSSLIFNMQQGAAKSNYITKTRLYNLTTQKTHFYIVKLGFTGVYIIFLILPKT